MAHVHHMIVDRAGGAEVGVEAGPLRDEAVIAIMDGVMRGRRWALVAIQRAFGIRTVLSRCQ